MLSWLLSKMRFLCENYYLKRHTDVSPWWWLSSLMLAGHQRQSGDKETVWKGSSHRQALQDGDTGKNKMYLKMEVVVIIFVLLTSVLILRLLLNL